LPSAGRRQPDAGREPHQIERIRHYRGLVEIVDAPDQPAFGIAPGAEIFQVQVADRQHLRCVHQIRAQFRDGPGPAEIGRAQEDERALPHPLVFLRDVILDHRALLAQPGLVGGIVLPKRHPALKRLE
jgi:hypothetical protein